MVANNHLNALLLADALAIFFLSKKRLQEKLNLLKILFLINKKCNKKDQISLKNTEIDRVNQYNHLSFIFKPSGKRHVHIDNLINKGRKGWFSVQKKLQNQNGKQLTLNCIRL